MIGFIRSSDVPVLIIGVLIAVPLSVIGCFALLEFFPRLPENVFVVLALGLVAISYVLAIRIWAWRQKRHSGS